MSNEDWLELHRKKARLRYTIWNTYRDEDNLKKHLKILGSVFGPLSPSAAESLFPELLMYAPDHIVGISSLAKTVAQLRGTEPTFTFYEYTLIRSAVEDDKLGWDVQRGINARVFSSALKTFFNSPELQRAARENCVMRMANLPEASTFSDSYLSKICESPRETLASLEREVGEVNEGEDNLKRATADLEMAISQHFEKLLASIGAPRLTTETYVGLFRSIQRDIDLESVGNAAYANPVAFSVRAKYLLGISEISKCLNCKAINSNQSKLDPLHHALDEHFPYLEDEFWEICRETFSRTWPWSFLAQTEADAAIEMLVVNQGFSGTLFELIFTDGDAGYRKPEASLDGIRVAVKQTDFEKLEAFLAREHVDSQEFAVAVKKLVAKDGVDPRHLNSFLSNLHPDLASIFIRSILSSAA